MAVAKKLSLTAKILIPSLAISLLLLSIFGGTLLQQRATAAELSLRSKVATMNNFLSQASVSYMENYDTPALQHFSKILSSDTDFTGVAFYGKDGKALTIEPPSDGSQVVETPIERGSEKFGTLKVFFRSKRGMIATDDPAWIYILAGILLVESILGFSIYFIIRTSVTSFSTQFGRLDETSTVLHTASETLQSGNTLLSTVFDEQASSIRTTVTTLDQMTATARVSQAKAKASASNVQNTKDLIFNIQNKFLSLVKSNEEVNEGNDQIVHEIRDSLTRLNEVVSIIKEIDNKTKVINEIVFQTRLLSFNASVEAARAGEAGRGFAVVAEEVGNLARLSGNSSQEITELLDKSTARVSEIITDMESKVKRAIEQGEGRSQSSVDVSEDCKQSINSMVDQISQFTDAVSQISESFDQQTRAVEEVNRAISEIHESSEQSLGQLQSSVSASVDLKERSLQLVNVVDALEIEVFGKKAS